MKPFEELNKLFGTEPTTELVPKVASEIVPLETKSKQEDQEDDYQLARQTLRDLVSTNHEVLGELVQLAKQSEHPRTFEVVGQLVKTQSEVAKDLLNLHKQQKDLQGDKGSTNKVGTQNNIVFAGSTNELMKLMKQQNIKDIEND